MGIATVYAYVGESDLAFEWLDRQLDRRRRPLGITHDPLFANLPADPRWAGVLERMGVSPAQLEALDFQVTLPQ